jgi:hypothetical protein
MTYAMICHTLRLVVQRTRSTQSSYPCTRTKTYGSSTRTTVIVQQAHRLVYSLLATGSMLLVYVLCPHTCALPIHSLSCISSTPVYCRPTTVY